jgi:hypothetical protein
VVSEEARLSRKQKHAKVVNLTEGLKMSRTIKDNIYKKFKFRKSYKRDKSLAQEFLDEYKLKNQKSDLIEL